MASLKQHKKIIILIGIILVILVVAVSIWYYFGLENKLFHKSANKTAPTNTQQAIPTDKLLAGTIKTISNDSIVLQLFTEKAETKGIKVNADTKYYRYPEGGGMYQLSSLDKFRDGEQTLVILSGSMNEKNPLATEIRLFVFQK